MSNPYGILHRCVIRRKSLPVLPCDCTICDWFIHDPFFNNCFWALADVMSESPGHPMTLEEIAEVEGISEAEVEKILEGAKKKCRLATRHWNDE